MHRRPPATRAPEGADARRGGAARAEADAHPVLHVARGGVPRGRPRANALVAHRPEGYATIAAVHEVAPGIHVIDTLLGGRPGVTAAYLVLGERPALVDTGPAHVGAGGARGAGGRPGWAPRPGVDRPDPRPPGPLRGHRHPRRRVPATPPWSCTGAAPATSPSPGACWRGRRPCTATAGRSTAGSTPRRPRASRRSSDGHRIDVGPGRALEVIETPGHARHHTCRGRPRHAAR